MNKKEACKKLKDLSFNVRGASGKFVNLENALYVVHEIDHHKRWTTFLESPIEVPRYVYDWIKQAKESNAYLTDCLKTAPKSVDEWLKKLGNEEILMLAWVLEEAVKVVDDKLYTVEIPDKGNDVVTHLSRAVPNVILTQSDPNSPVPWKNWENNHLTKEEIKENFPWAWVWAEEVRKQ